MNRSWLFLALVLLIGCQPVLLQPQFRIYVDRDDVLISELLAFGRQLGRDFGLVVVERKDQSGVDFDNVLSASGSSWFYRTLAIGKPEGSEFTIFVRSDHYAVAGGSVDPVESADLEARWKRFFEDKGVEARSNSQR